MQSKDWDKISKDYYANIISPIKNGKKPNPLLEYLNKLNNNNKALDLGCGIGPLEPLIADKFKVVTAIDFSQDMINKAKSLNKNNNVTFEVADMTNLKEYNDYDYAFSINSILSPKIQNINLILKEIYITLKNKGKFIAVMPAMESYIYQGMLIMNRELNKGKTQHIAKKIAEKFLEPKEHDLITGKINYEGEQKTFYRFEIKHRLKKAGFTNIKIKKLRYKWVEWKNAGQNYFPKEDSPWDWYVECEKN